MDFIEVNSEIGQLEGVVLHTPGVEIERMTPENIHEALYSDLLNLNIAKKEYANFEGVLSKWTKTYQVVDLLTEVLENKTVKADLLDKIFCKGRTTISFCGIVRATRKCFGKISH